MPEIAKGDPQNNGRTPAKPKHSRFALKEHRQQTMRFGENTPHLVFNGVPNDFTKFISKRRVDSYTLKAPLQAPIFMDMDYFYVPRMAILPLNYEEKCFKNPKIGDDVVETDNVGTSVSGAQWTKLWQALMIFAQDCDIYIGTAGNTDTDNLEALTNYIKTIVMLENFFSYGGMFTAMGCNVESLLKCTFNPNAGSEQTGTFDRYSNILLNNIELFLVGLSNTKRSIGVQIDLENFHITAQFDGNGNKVNTGNEISWREFLCRIRQTMNWKFTNLNLVPGDSIQWSYMKMKPANRNIFEFTPLEKPIDTARFWAYQLACAEYYTNDNVDYLYSAELFRQAIGEIVNRKEQGNGYPYTFTYNGVMYRYDYLSAFYTSLFINEIESILTSNPDAEENWDNKVGDVSMTYMAEYFQMMLKYTRSLKYRDYFVGSRVRPLAKGDINVNVVGGQFNVVDSAIHMQIAKYAQVLNKLKSGVKDYTAGIFGIKPKPDWHSPLWIGSTEDIIYGEKTENTGEAQMTNAWSVTATLKNQGRNKAHTVKFDRDAIIVGITHFDVERAYTNTIDRHFFHEDRYDRFNPYLQYTGDQALYKEEVNPALGSGDFGYKDAYAEFKQTYNKAMGGFVECLPGWAFLTDYVEPSINAPIAANIRPDYIRARQNELDKFYIKINGSCLAYYFHFILNIENEIEADRPMAVNPQLF